MRKILSLLAAFGFLAAPRPALAGFTAHTGADTILTPDSKTNGRPDIGETIDLVSVPVRGATSGTFLSFVPDGPSDPQIRNGDLPLYGYSLHGTVTAIKGTLVAYAGTYAIRYFDPSGTVYDVSAGTFGLDAQFAADGTASLKGHLHQTAGPSNSAFADLGYLGDVSYTGTYAPTVVGHGLSNRGSIQGVLLASYARPGFTAITSTDTILTPDANSNGLADVGETIDLAATPPRGATSGSFVSYTPNGPSDPQIHNGDLPLYGYSLHGTVTAIKGTLVTYAGTYAIRYFDPSGTIYDVSTGTFKLDAQFAANGTASLTGHLHQNVGPSNSAFADLGYLGEVLYTGIYTPTIVCQGTGNKGTIQGVLRASAPQLRLLPGGAPPGANASMVVKAVLNGASSINGAEVHIRFDPTHAAVANQGATFTAAPGWITQSFTLAGGNEAIWVGANAIGQSADGPVVTVTARQNSQTWGVMTLTTASSVSDQDYMPWSQAANQDAALVNGAVRDLGMPIQGAVSAGPGKVLAVATGGRLRRLDAATLADKSGFVSPAIGPVSGRPVFGMFGTPGTILAVIAVGDDAGALTIVDASSGAVVFRQTLGAEVSTPAIDIVHNPDEYTARLYAGVTNASGPASLVRAVGGSLYPLTALNGTRVLGAPAIFGGGIAVGTDWGTEVYRVDGTPQAGIHDSAGATIAPIVGPRALSVSANAGKLFFFNIVTGAPTFGAKPQTAGALSEAWGEWNTPIVAYGTPSGSLLTVDVTTGVQSLGPVITPSRIAAEPITLNGVTWAEDVNGVLANTSGAYIPLAGPSSGAVVATGRPSGSNYLIAGTADGILASIPF